MMHGLQWKFSETFEITNGNEMEEMMLMLQATEHKLDPFCQSYDIYIIHVNRNSSYCCRLAACLYIQNRFLLPQQRHTNDKCSMQHWPSHNFVIQLWVSAMPAHKTKQHIKCVRSFEIQILNTTKATITKSIDQFYVHV